jgi:hypothetical protein
MKKILLLVLVSLFVSPLFVFADWCSNVGGIWADNANGMDTCYCPGSDGKADYTKAASSSSNCSSSSSSTTTDWCTAAGGKFCDNGSHTNCYCSDGEILAGSSCSNSNSFSCSQFSLTAPGGTTTTTTPTTGTTTTTTTTTTTVGSGTGIISNPIKATSFAELINMITKWILDIAMVLAPLIIVYGGFTYITAAGDPGKMETGKKIIIYAVLGFILALLATSLVDVFKTFVSGTK